MVCWCPSISINKTFTKIALNFPAKSWALYICIYTYIHIYKHTYIYIYIHIYIYVCVYIHIYTYVYVCVYMCVYVCVCVCVCIYIPKIDQENAIVSIVSLRVTTLPPLFLLQLFLGKPHLFLKYFQPPLLKINPLPPLQQKFSCFRPLPPPPLQTKFFNATFFFSFNLEVKEK